MEKEIEYYETITGECPYIEWLESLDNFHTNENFKAY